MRVNGILSLFSFRDVCSADTFVVVKDTIQNLIVKKELPATATNLVITTPRTSCIYFCGEERCVTRQITAA